MSSGAQVGLDHFFVLLHVVRRALGDLLAVVEHGDAVAQAHDELDVVLDQQDGAVVVADTVDQLAQHHLLGGVHAGGRLVERDQLRVGGERAGDLQAPLVAVGQCARLVVGVAPDAHVFQQLLRAPGDGRLFALEARRAENRAKQARMGADVPAHHHVLERRHFREQADVLEGAGNARLGHQVHRLGLVGLARQLEGAAVGRVQPGDDVEEGRLAGAVGADQAIHLAALDGDADVRERLQAAETLGDAGDLEHHIVGFLCHVLSFCVFRTSASGSCHARAQATGRADAAASR